MATSVFMEMENDTKSELVVEMMETFDLRKLFEADTFVKKINMGPGGE